MLVYNMHQLLHLGLYVSRWGPLWATSAFAFENYNGFLAHSLHGTKNVGQELVNTTKMYEGYLILKNKMESFEAIFLDENKLKVLGRPIKLLQNLDLQQLEIENYNIKDFIYARAVCKNIIYTSLIHKTLKTNTYTVHLQLSNEKIIYGFIKFFFLHDNILKIYLQPLSIEQTNIIYHKDSGAQMSHILLFDQKDAAIVIDTTEIMSISPLTQVGNYICISPNLLQKIL